MATGLPSCASMSWMLAKAAASLYSAADTLVPPCPMHVKSSGTVQCFPDRTHRRAEITTSARVVPEGFVAEVWGVAWTSKVPSTMAHLPSVLGKAVVLGTAEV